MQYKLEVVLGRVEYWLNPSPSAGPCVVKLKTEPKANEIQTNLTGIQPELQSPCSYGPHSIPSSPTSQGGLHILNDKCVYCTIYMLIGNGYGVCGDQTLPTPKQAQPSFYFWSNWAMCIWVWPSPSCAPDINLIRV